MRAFVSCVALLSILAASSGCGNANRPGSVAIKDVVPEYMPGDLETTVRETLRFPNIALKGIGTNLACRSGVVPDAKNMAELSALADSIEATFGLRLSIISGGNSGSLQWALGSADTGRINNLRLGESILLGREPLGRAPIDGLHTDAITLIAEVIELKAKPSRPWDWASLRDWHSACRDSPGSLVSHQA